MQFLGNTQVRLYHHKRGERQSLKRVIFGGGTRLKSGTT